MFTYTKNPKSAPRDAVRFLLGDTDQANPQLDDSEIAYLLDQAGNDPTNAAVLGANALAASYARLADKSVGDLSISYSQVSKNYKDLADRLSVQGLAAVPPYLGAIEVANATARETDTSLAQPQFRLGMMDNAS